MCRTIIGSLTVIVRNEGRFFYVRGQVKNPNQFPYLKEMTVTKAIAAAGDFTDFAKKNQGSRDSGRRPQRDRQLHQGDGDPKLDVPIYPDDTI